MKQNLLTYISLFSGAGIGCFGFKQENFHCIATVEILDKRLQFQRFNNKCIYPSGYIADDIRKENVKEKIKNELELWKKQYKNLNLDVLIATPPCQGMSLANHKKKDEIGRNSLVTESIILTKELNPKFFIFENVRAFLTTSCTDIDGRDKPIKQAIEVNLAGNYNIYYQTINFKDYGSPSSRTRTLVVGVRKDIWEITPLNIFPDLQTEKILRETIGHLKPLKWGEIDETDIYHSFKIYKPEMENWLKELKEGQSAFDNINIENIPHHKENGLIIYNTNKNGDKYKRQYWDKVAPCIHTRNDILSSQNTVHPVDNRVFSIRELALMMSIPNDFNFSDVSPEELNKLSLEEKKAFLKKNEMNIRHSIGEAVPTIIFRQIAAKIKKNLHKPILTDTEINKLLEKQDLSTINNINNFIVSLKNKLPYPSLAKIAELANSVRTKNAAFYTRQDICYTIIKDLPNFKNNKVIRILEPSVGVGNFLPLIIEKYKSIPNVIIDVLDIDNNSIETLKILITCINLPENIKINFINDDFLLHKFETKYDLVVGNPPYKKITGEKKLLEEYKKGVFNSDTNNIFSFFIEKAIKLGDYVSLIVPKSLINAPEFNKTRELLSQFEIIKINDYGEEGFKGVKIETISFIINTHKKSNPKNIVEVESYFLKQIYYQKQGYIFSNDFPYWLIYRDSFFDKVSEKLNFNIFKAYRDRQITKKITKVKGKVRVLKSRNIANNEIINIEGYDCFIDELESLDVSKFINIKSAVLVPNLTYNPRACFLPNNCIADGSVAILTLKNGSHVITSKDLEYFSSQEFIKFYAISRNHGTRSLNIDNNSVFFFGIQKDNQL